MAKAHGRRVSTPYSETVPFWAWVFLGVGVFGVSVAYGLSWWLQKRMPRVSPPPAKLRTVWHGRPAVDDGGCCDDPETEA